MVGKESTIGGGVLDENQQETATQLLSKGRYALLGVGLLALGLPWLTISGFFNESISGFTFDTGKVYLLVLVAIAAIDYTEFKLARSTVWLGGGVVLTLLAGLSWVMVDSAISDYQMETAGNPFAGAVSMSAGSGLYLAVLVGVLAIAVGWALRQSPPARPASDRVD